MTYIPDQTTALFWSNGNILVYSYNTPWGENNQILKREWYPSLASLQSMIDAQLNGQPEPVITQEQHNYLSNQISSNQFPYFVTHPRLEDAVTGWYDFQGAVLLWDGDGEKPEPPIDLNIIFIAIGILALVIGIYAAWRWKKKKAEEPKKE